MDQFLKFKEVQDRFGISRSTLWRWHTERGLRVMTVGGITRIREADLEAFVKRYENEKDGKTPAGTVEVNAVQIDSKKGA